MLDGVGVGLTTGVDAGLGVGVDKGLGVDGGFGVGVGLAEPLVDAEESPGVTTRNLLDATSCGSWACCPYGELNLL